MMKYSLSAAAGAAARRLMFLSIFIMSMANYFPQPAIAFLPPTPALSGGAPLNSQANVATRLLGCTRRWRAAGRRDTTTTLQAGEKNLFDVIRDEDLDTLRSYIERGGPVHVADTLGDTSLLVAASTGNAELVKLLASAPDAQVNYPCFHGGETPLMVACTQGYLGVAKYLVNEAGANVNAMNHRGDTSLSLAAFWGKLDCLKFLLNLPEIDTEIQNVQGKRAGEDMEELMRDESSDQETIALLRESRVRQGVTRL